MARIGWWLLSSSLGRLGLGAMAVFASLLGVVSWAEHKGVQKQVARQEQADVKAKGKADKARAAVKPPVKAKGQTDAFQRD